MTEELMEIAMNLIVYAGNAKAKAAEAISLSKEGKFAEAQAAFKEADSEIIEAHHTQKEIMTNEANGEHIVVTLLIVHAQDHLMNAMTFIDMAKEIVALYEFTKGKK